MNPLIFRRIFKSLLSVLFLLLVACNLDVSISEDDGSDQDDGAGGENGTVQVVTEVSGQGTLDPEEKTVETGETAEFTLTPDTGFEIGAVSGCAGNVSGNIYTTGAISDDCTVEASFEGDLSISGTLSVGAYHQVDGTLNDPNADYQPNNAPNNAQRLPNPTVVGGYVTDMATGESGDQFETEADPEDYYQVSLFAGQRVTLYTGGFDQDNQLGLFLFDPNDPNNAVDSAVDEEVLQVKAPEAADYLVQVTANPGASSYVMTAGESASLSAMGLPRPLRPHLEIVPGEVLVSLAEDDSRMRMLSAATPGQTTAQALADTLGLDLVGRISAGDREFHRLQTDSLDNASERLQRLGIHSSVRTPQPMSTQPAAQQETWALIRSLARDPGVQAVLPQYVETQLQMYPNDPEYQHQWHYDMMELAEAWSVTQGSSDVVVSVIDSGIDIEHPDLQDKIRNDGWDFYDDQPIAAEDADEHGTHVAGTVGADTDNNEGVAGAGWDVSIMPLRVCGENFCINSFEAVQYAAGQHPDRQPDQVADIINLSLGGSFSSDAVNDIYQAACNAGLLVVASAGNDNTAEAKYPASYDCVFSVAALGPSQEKASYSSYGEFVELTAPGGDIVLDLNEGIRSTHVDADGNSGYAWQQGTSMSAPHVSGVFGLMRSLNADITPDVVRSWLQSGDIVDKMDDMGGADRTDEHGYGMLNAHKAVQAADNIDPMLTLSHSSMRFDPVTAPRTFEIGATRDGITVKSVEEDAGWIEIDNSDADADTGLGEYTVSMSADTPEIPGFYEQEITVTGDDDTALTLSVIYRAPEEDEPATWAVGPVYVMLLDGEGDVVESTQADYEQGEYHYQFKDLNHSEYTVVAGSDMANSKVVCEPGDACGKYPEHGEPEVVELVDQPVTEVNFNLDFRFRIQHLVDSATGQTYERLDLQGSSAHGGYAR